MAVLSVTEDFTGLGAECHGESDGRTFGAGSRFFDVVFDEADVPAVRPFIAKSTTAIDPATSVAVPQLGDLHPYQQNNLVYVASQTVSVTDDSPMMYRVEVGYKEIRNPLEEPSIIEWLSASTMEPIDIDIDGKAILTSSDEPFDPPPTQKFDDLVLRAMYNVPFFNPVEAGNYKNAVNDAPILIHGQYIFLAGQAKVVTYTSREIRAITGYFYVEVTVEIQFRYEGWKRKFIDQGYRIKTGTDDDGKPTYEEIKDDDGNLITEPVLLDGLGQKLKDGDPVFRIEHWTNRQLNFTSEFGAFL